MGKNYSNKLFVFSSYNKDRHYEPAYRLTGKCDEVISKKDCHELF